MCARKHMSDEQRRCGEKAAARLVSGPAAVDGYRRTGDGAGGIGAEIDAELRDLEGLDESGRRLRSKERSFERFFLAEAAAVALDELRLLIPHEIDNHRAGTTSVGGDTVI